MLCNKRSHCNEKPVNHNKAKSSPYSPQLEKARQSNEAPAHPKVKLKKKKFKEVVTIRDFI